MIPHKWIIFVSLIVAWDSVAMAQPSPLPPVNMPPGPASTPQISATILLPPATVSPSAANTPNPATALTPPNFGQSVDTTLNSTQPISNTGSLPLTPFSDDKPTGSMGKSSISIFFTPLQTRAMKEALEEYESKPMAKTDANLEINSLDKKEDPKLIEPDIYPVFYLSSIAYHSPKDWSIWVSGHKITSDTNKTDLSVLSVNENQASFLWKPKFNKAIITRKEKNIFAPVEAGLKNKLTAKPNFNYNSEEGTFAFTLRTNQTFAVAYMNIFEGFLSSPKLPALPVEAKQEASEPITAPGLEKSKSPSGQYARPTNPELEIGTRPLMEMLKNAPPATK